MKLHFNSTKQLITLLSVATGLTLMSCHKDKEVASSDEATPFILNDSTLVLPKHVCCRPLLLKFFLRLRRLYNQWYLWLG